MKKPAIVIGENDDLNECLRCGEPMPNAPATQLYCATCIYRYGSHELHARCL